MASGVGGTEAVLSARNLHITTVLQLIAAIFSRIILIFLLYVVLLTPAYLSILHPLWKSEKHIHTYAIVILFFLLYAIPWIHGLNGHGSMGLAGRINLDRPKAMHAWQTFGLFQKGKIRAAPDRL